MNPSTMLRRTLPIAALAGLALALLPAPASAHPLGNFSINQLIALTLRPAAVDATAVLDVAELPTLQQRGAVDTSGDGVADAPELRAHATAACDAVARDLAVRVDDRTLRWAALSAAMTLEPGSAGLPTSRITCTLSAPARLDQAAVLTVHNGHLADRVGWREITAVGIGVDLPGSPVPSRSTTNELRDYPVDLLGSPLDVRDARVSARPAAAPVGSPATGLGSAATPDLGGSARPDDLAPLRWAAWAQQQVLDTVGAERLTPLVGLLAVLLALVLGAGHALLPGHGKTVMAVYLAGRAGRPRDALTVGATVTATHTGGVIALGLLLTAVSGLTGQTVLGWLGLASGTIVITVGFAMLLTNLRRRPTRGHPRDTSDHDHGPHGHHAHEHGSHGHHAHEHGSHGHGSHGHDAHDHGSHSHGSHGQGAHHPASHIRGLLAHGSAGAGSHGHVHRHGLFGRAHSHGGGHAREDTGRGRFGLGAIGVAAGLVPSPSALVVLLGAIALGRTGFGILLVLAYGLGMAGTLTVAGLLLLKVRDRWAGRFDRFRRLRLAGPYAASAMVLLVGLGLAARAATLVV
ncbi:urease accessory protein UreH domain-containing protein [Catellatospora paridis]|uniref:urease accessory protein UreH domain-containing protein n=1 Tax=Catellatospora paridis TaxID=1617086 RepID=UPI001E2DEFB1|nr:sulfite exporter TauE/SafE family protein [Catellatospora paridis]